MNFDILELKKYICANEQDLLDEIASNNGWYSFNKTPSPICLVAHVDTYQRPVIDFGIKDNYLFNTNGVLGGDDRVGCYFISQLKQFGYSILLCNGEESGGLGAIKAAEQCDFSGIKLFVEFDYPGYMQYAVYLPQKKKLHTIVQSFGYKECIGSFTDIAIINSIPGLNLSVAYYNQHTDKEHINVKQCIDSLELSRRILVAYEQRYCTI